MSVYVGPEGPTSSHIAFVGEAPGRDEEIQRRPFVGGSGRLLNQMLQRVGINRSDCYITNIVKYRPPSNDFSFFYSDGARRQQPSPQLVASIDQLKEELLRVKPNVICCLGGEPLRALTGRLGITKWRGSILPSPVGKVVATFHPAAILRDYADKPIAELDLARVKLESKTPEILLPKPKFLLAPTAREAIDWIKAVRPGDRLSFDIETVPIHADDPVRRSFLIRCLGLARSAQEAICIPFMSDPAQCISRSGIIQFDQSQAGLFSNHYSEDDEYAILQALAQVFSDTRIRKVAQNAPFDMYRLASQFGIHVNGLELDTMGGWHTLYSELPKGLDFLASIFTRVPYYSDHDNSVDLDEWKYNCWDAVCTWEIAEPIIRELKGQGLWEVYQNHVQPTMFAATRSEHRGILVDHQMMKEKTVEVDAKLESLTAQVRQITQKPEFNPNSPKQVAEFLYGTLGLPVQYARKRNKDGIKPVTTDKHARDQLAKRFPQFASTLRLLDDYSTEETLKTGFLSRPVRSDNRMYTHFNTFGTLNRRMASSDPGDEAGTNLQNLPIRTTPWFRDLFIADNNWSLIKADLSAAEYMVVIWRANIRRIIDRFINEPDFSPHRMMASKIYGIPESQVDKESLQYQCAKNGNYGGNYGMMPDKASIVWKVPLADAKFILDAYHKATPEISGVYWPWIQHQIVTKRELVSPLGPRRMFFGRIDEAGGPYQEIFRDAYNAYPQGIVADVINRAWHLVDEAFDPNECHVLLQIHDELLFHCRNELLWKYLPLVKRFMEYPIRFDGNPTPLTIPADISYGPRWGKKWQTKWRLAA